MCHLLSASLSPPPRALFLPLFFFTGTLPSVDLAWCYPIWCPAKIDMFAFLFSWQASSALNKSATQPNFLFLLPPSSRVIFTSFIAEPSPHMHAATLFHSKCFSDLNLCTYGIDSSMSLLCFQYLCSISYERQESMSVCCTIILRTMKLKSDKCLTQDPRMRSVAHHSQCPHVTYFGQCSYQ